MKRVGIPRPEIYVECVPWRKLNLARLVNSGHVGGTEYRWGLRDAIGSVEFSPHSKKMRSLI